MQITHRGQNYEKGICTIYSSFSHLLVLNGCVCTDGSYIQEIQPLDSNLFRVYPSAKGPNGRLGVAPKSRSISAEIAFSVTLSSVTTAKA